MEPNDVDCNANNVHAQAQFHLQAKANTHIDTHRCYSKIHTISDVPMPDAE